jgi:predicted transcriptional regulator YheO
MIRVPTYSLIMNDGKRENVTILCLNTNFWKIANFEFMLVVHKDKNTQRERERESGAEEHNEKQKVKK